MDILRSPYYSDENLVKEHLKQFIRQAEAEQQAYKLGYQQKLKYMFPKLSKTGLGKNLVDKLSSRLANSGWKWAEKIDAMKEAYSKIAYTERKKLATETNM